MKLRMFAVFDKAISAFNPPFCCRTDGEAKRSFATEVQNAQSQIGKYRADYCLYFIGVYDDSVGVVSADTPPFVIAEAVSILNEMEA